MGMDTITIIHFLNLSKLKFMKLFKCFILLATGLVIFSCSPDETLVNENQNDLVEQSLEFRSDCTESGYDVTFTINGNSITMDAVGSAVNLLAIHDASNYAVVETLCVPWNSNLPNCGPGITSQTHPDGDYLLKVKTSSGFNWLSFTLPCDDDPVTCDPVEVSFPGGGDMVVECIDSDVYRLDVHNLSYGAVASVCNPWGAPEYCTVSLPFTHTGLPTGDHLLRVESPGLVEWIEITIN